MIIKFQVVLFNRGDCCQERLNNYIITIGNSLDGSDSGVCVQDGGDVSRRGEITNVCSPPLQGRYVHVKLPGQGRTLSLCEVQVYEKECY